MSGGKKKKTTFGDILRMIIMLIALGVFCYSGYTLYTFYREYKTGSDEYDNLEANYSNAEPEEETQDAGQDGLYASLANTDSLEDDEILRRLQVIDGLRIAADGSPIFPEDEEVDEELSAFLRDLLDRGRIVAATENGVRKYLLTMKNPIDFEELEGINEDICGWLKIRAIDISYPLVIAEDNDFYLHRTFEKTDNFAGCLFVNCGNERDFCDQNTIIYGHNMRNGSMFGKLKTFREEEVWNKSHYFWVFTKDFIYQYRIISGMTVPKTGYAYQTEFSEEKFQEFLDIAMEKSELDNKKAEVSTEDRIVTLSTCTTTEANRFVIMGKVAKVYASRNRVEYLKQRELELEAAALEAESESESETEEPMTDAPIPDVIYLN